MATNFVIPPARPVAPVATNVLADVDIRQVKPPLDLPSPLFWILLGVLAALLAVAGGWAWRRWRRQAAAPKPEIYIPPHVIALDQLRAALELLDQPEPFCVRVSNVLRAYLERQFKYHAPERTTEEFLAEVQSSYTLSLDQKRTLASFLERCDLVKFARERPGREDLTQLYDIAVRLVEETTGGAAAAEPQPPAAPPSSPPRRLRTVSGARA